MEQAPTINPRAIYQVNLSKKRNIDHVANLKALDSFKALILQP
jgi:hypothetical protein